MSSDSAFKDEEGLTMARGSKSGGGAIGVVVIGLLALLAAIPKEVWIGLGVLAVVGVAIYFFNQNSSETVSNDAPPPAGASRSSST